MTDAVRVARASEQQQCERLMRFQLAILAAARGGMEEGGSRTYTRVCLEVPGNGTYLAEN